MSNSNFTKAIKVVKKSIVEDAKDIEKYIMDCINEPTLKLFEVQDPIKLKTLKCDEELKKLKNDFGIYVFVSEANLRICANTFNQVCYGSKTNKNFESKSKTESKKLIIYVGKSFEIKKRVGEHICGKDGSTYSLKLGHEMRKHVIENEKSELYVFMVNSEEYDEKIKAMIIAMTESILHEDLKPIVGTSRT